METWREDASDQAQADFQALVDASLPFAHRVLALHREFHPYAMALGEDGTVSSVGVLTGDDEHPESVVVIAGLTEALRAAVGIRAAAITYDARIKAEKTDAITVLLETKDGSSLMIQQPYKLRRMRRKPRLGELRALPARASIWGHGT